MRIAKSTFHEYKNPTKEHFDPEQEILRFEEKYEKTICEDMKEIIHNFAPIINRAYKNGLRDGRKASH